MPSILDSLNAAAPALWLEVSPPRGINPAPLLRRLAELAGHVDAINLTDNAFGKVKMSGLVFGAAIKERLKIPVVLNMSCRDRNRFALKSDLLGAAAIGIDAIVALNGDKIPPGADGNVIVSHDIDAYGLLAMVAALNRGDTGEGKALLKALPSIVVGSVANPNRKNIEREFELLERKAAAGACFVITQPVFDAETGRRFVARANTVGVKTMLGILPVKREAMANLPDRPGEGLERRPEPSGQIRRDERRRGARDVSSREPGVDEVVGSRRRRVHHHERWRPVTRNRAGA